MTLYNGIGAFPWKTAARLFEGGQNYGVFHDVSKMEGENLGLSDVDVNSKHREASC